MPKRGGRILTTHAGSLPRPPELTHLFTRRSRGETVDEDALASAGREAVAWVVAKQREVGIDIISNGEQRGSLVLSAPLPQRYRAAQGTAPFADIESYPKLKRSGRIFRARGGQQRRPPPAHRPHRQHGGRVTPRAIWGGLCRPRPDAAALFTAASPGILY
jgi:5-methyltetrahydropteroyltriglutamate--homocysteine methyltransferase